MREPLMILVAGPYRSGTGGDPDRMAANVEAMTGKPAPVNFSRKSGWPERLITVPWVESSTRR